MAGIAGTTITGLPDAVSTACIGATAVSRFGFVQFYT